MAAAERVICDSEDLVDAGDGVRFEIEREGRVQAAFAIRHAGKVHAYVNRCAHVAVELDWQLGKFFDVDGVHLICSTHGAIYAPDTGLCVQGPCKGSRLVAIPVTEANGKVVHTSHD
jgi:nitrite reductase/ring-hydroxylating ferredoxin subunit